MRDPASGVGDVGKGGSGQDPTQLWERRTATMGGEGCKGALRPIMGDTPLSMSSVMAARGRVLLAALLGAPAAAIAAAELLAVAAGRSGGAVPAGVHTYLPLIARTGRLPLSVGAVVLAALSLTLLRGTSRVAGIRLAAGGAASGQLCFFGLEVLLLGGLDAIPDAPVAFGTALLLQILAAMVGVLIGSVVRSTVRLLVAAVRTRRPSARVALRFPVVTVRPRGRNAVIPHRRGPPALLLSRN